MVMEKLAYLINQRVEEKLWKPFRISRGGLSVSHLFFADDIMLFAKASHQQLDVILDCLNSFAGCSGLVLNLNKSKLFLSPNIQSVVANSFSAKCNIPLSANLGKYLGVPILHKRKTGSDYRFILEKIQSKLAGWKKSLLSLAGRKTLIQSVTSAIPCYTMQTVLLPKSTCEAIDKLNRQFLWGSDTESRKPHLVNWESVCMSKEEGGLGLRSAWSNNRALVSKLGWKMITNDESLWCKALRAKYLKNKSLFNVQPPPSSSATWRSILSCRDVLKMGLRWRVGTGDNINFWNDIWVGDLPLRCHLVGPLDRDSLSWTVSHVISTSRDWKVEVLLELLPLEVVEEIRAIPLASQAEVCDTLYWAGTTDGNFTTKSAFSLIQRSHHQIVFPSFNWRWIWRLPCSERIRMFMWLVFKGRLFTNVHRYNCYLTSSPACPRCNLELETPFHILRDCQFARSVWAALGIRDLEFFTWDLTTWVQRATSSRRKFGDTQIPWTLVFLSALWLLWKDRNKLVFEQSSTLPFVLCSNILQHSHYTFLAQRSGFSARRRDLRWVAWKPPPLGWYKLNTDGALSHVTGLATAGGLVRDSYGKWVQGFTVNIGHTSSFMAELWGVREGIRTCRTLGITELVVEMDSMVAIQLLSGDRDPGGPASAILADIRALLATFSLL
ncbi:hypothetical protein SLEP1_g59152 [Rubroshorea leprosula]|uniref:Uncharacterized protein n=1 Tax=Rubroshorea leprosula TaxID=152421 RepID=A0AAV5MSQ6_9ROSI|nr:hypothetical protein SLEP1_g59152 [Rubroshorea leprosula]